MSFQQAIWTSRQDYLKKCQPELPVSFFNPAALTGTAKMFQGGFPGLVTYAVKANPARHVLKCLAAAGIDAFDVASPAEIDLVRSIAPNATLHYHNPIRSIQEIKHAVAEGVTSFSVDRPAELEKLLQYIPKVCEISVRLKLDLEGAAYDFGTKFGADPDMCATLLRRVWASGHRTSMTFHPGTQCNNPDAWTAYISACSKIAERAGCTLYRMNVGGGFPSHRTKEQPRLQAFFEAIQKAVLQSFPTAAPELVCEPGRAMVADSHSLAVCVKALSENTIFLNDGVYGGLTEFRDIGHIERYKVISQSEWKSGKPCRKYTVFGPTCDSIDQLPAPLSLPKTIAEGDYILFENMGAYTQSIATPFNGYGTAMTVTITKV